MKKAFVCAVVALAAMVVWAQLTEREDATDFTTVQTQPTTDAMPAWHVMVDNFPNPQQVAGTVDIGNLPSVQQVEVVNPSSGGIVNVALDLLDTPLDLDANAIYNWTSEPFDTSQYNRIGLRHFWIAGGSPVYCQPYWRWSADLPFDQAYGDCINIGTTGNAEVGNVCGTEAVIHCYVAGPFSTLTDVRVWLRRE